MWELNARDAAAARAFYRSVFGWEISEPISEPWAEPVQLATVTSGPGGIDGVIGRAPAPDDPDAGQRHSGLIVYVKVGDVEATLAAVEANGGRRIWGPTEVHPGLTVAQFDDPEGIRFGLST
jgi:predicted enzyme related to lactoylglutathione lyase